MSFDIRNYIPNYTKSYDIYDQISFECTLCGLCCEWFIYSAGIILTKNEEMRTKVSLQYIRSQGSFVDLSEITNELRLPYILEKGKKNVAKCIFQPISGTGKCKMYHNRPFDCRIYPLFVDYHSSGSVIFILQHCEGIRFDGKGIDLLDLNNFFSTFFESIDFDVLRIFLDTKLEKKPRLIPLFPGFNSSWESRKEILSKLFARVSKKTQSFAQLYETLFNEYLHIRESYEIKQPYEPKIASIYESVGGKYKHLINGETIHVNKSLQDTMISSKIISFIYKYLYEHIMRERRYAVNVNAYRMTLDDELNFILSILSDVFTAFHHFTKLKGNEIDGYRYALSRVDMYPDYYLTSLGVLSVKKHPKDIF